MVLLVLVVVVLVLVLDVALVLLVEENLRFESLPPASTWRYVQAAPFQHLPSLK